LGGALADAAGSADRISGVGVLGALGVGAGSAAAGGCIGAGAWAAAGASDPEPNFFNATAPPMLSTINAARPAATSPPELDFRICG